MEASGFSEEEVDNIEREAKDEIQRATEMAMKLPDPDPAFVEDEVYAP